MNHVLFAQRMLIAVKSVQTDSISMKMASVSQLESVDQETAVPDVPTAVLTHHAKHVLLDTSDSRMEQNQLNV